MQADTGLEPSYRHLADPTAAEPAGWELSYWHLHLFLLLPTLLLLLFPPRAFTSATDALTRKAAFTYLGFILAIAVAQAFVWDSVGTQMGLWVFNPAKCTGLGMGTVLPLEEILWLFHHVMKAALFQLKISEIAVLAPRRAPAQLSRLTRAVGNAVLVALSVGGGFVLVSGNDSAKCLALVSAFFAPVLLILWNLGGRYLRSHWRLFLAGWFVPGWWTVLIDCIGQQQGVWSFPPRYLTGVAALGGWLKLDIAAVYLVSTLAVTASGAIVLAAVCELLALDEAEADNQAMGAAEEEARGLVLPRQPGGDSGAGRGLLDLEIFIFENAYPGLTAPLFRPPLAGLLRKWGIRPRPPPPAEAPRRLGARAAQV